MVQYFRCKQATWKCQELHAPAHSPRKQPGRRMHIFLHTSVHGLLVLLVCSLLIGTYFVINSCFVGVIALLLCCAVLVVLLYSSTGRFSTTSHSRIPRKNGKTLRKNGKTGKKTKNEVPPATLVNCPTLGPVQTENNKT